MSMRSILQLNEVHYRYNSKTVLAIPALEIKRGSIMGLAGPNGSGKTTLLKLLARIEKPSVGSVNYLGGKPDDQGCSFRQEVSLLPQETYLLKRSVYDNIAYGLKIRNRKNGMAKAINAALELVGLDQSFSKRQWHELSGGEAQRVALAGRLVLKPDCLLLDEPTASVDMESARCIRRAILLAREEWGATVVIASHHRTWLNDICDRIIYLYNGRVLDCSYENILTGPWEAVDETTVACTLSDGQKVYGTRPPQPGCSGIIAAQEIQIGQEPFAEEGICSVQGTISAIMLENLQDSPHIHVSCGDQRFVVSITDTVLKKEMYRPGMQVWLCYRKDALTWLEKQIEH